MNKLIAKQIKLKSTIRTKFWTKIYLEYRGTCLEFDQTQRILCSRKPPTQVEDPW